MSSKSGDGGNKVTGIFRLCVYALLTALCLVIGFAESFIPTDAAVPGVKLGLANSVALLLVCKGDAKGAFAVNTARIILSGLLFGSAMSLLFSFTAGTGSLVAMTLIKKANAFDTVGLSVAGAVIHNLIQLAVAVLVVGTAAAVWLPVLILSGIISGAATGTLCTVILKKVETKRKK